MPPESNLVFRHLAADEVEKIWSIDRAEIISAVYYIIEDKLVLKDEHYDMTTWPLGEPEIYAPLLQECHQRGGWFLGVFDGDTLVAVSVLDTHFLGPQNDSLQLKFLQISQNYRGLGLGRELFHRAAAEAARRGARKMYISATPSEHTIHFYMKNGCCRTATPDPVLYALEPEDIHLEYEISPADWALLDESDRPACA